MLFRKASHFTPVSDRTAALQRWLNAMGCTPPLVVDGLGGADILTSKLAIIGPSTVPDADVDYLFFVLDCAAATPGAHAFSVTYEEHLANVTRCQ